MINLLIKVVEELRQLKEQLEKMSEHDSDRNRVSRQRVSLKYRENGSNTDFSSDEETVHDSDWYTSFHKIRKRA